MGLGKWLDNKKQDKAFSNSFKIKEKEFWVNEEKYGYGTLWKYNRTKTWVVYLALAKNKDLNTEAINEHFKNEIQYQKYDLLYDFLFLKTGLDKSFMKKINDPNDEEEKEYALKKQDIVSMYEYTIIGRNGDGFRFSNSNDLFKNKLNFNLMYSARIFEQYIFRWLKSLWKWS